MSDLYRLTKTQMVEGSMHAMNGGTYMGHLVSVTIDYEAADNKVRDLTEFIVEMVKDVLDDKVTIAEIATIQATPWSKVIVDAALAGDE